MASRDNDGRRPFVGLSLDMLAPAERDAMIEQAMRLLSTVLAEKASSPTAPTHLQVFRKFKLHMRVNLEDSRSDTARLVFHVLRFRPEATGPRLAHMPITEASRHLVNLYRLTRAKQVSARTKRTPKVATLNREVAAWRCMLNYAEAELLAGREWHNPIAKIKMPKENNIKRTTLRDDAVERLLQACNEMGFHLLRAVILCWYDTGMRRMELLELRRDQVDWDTGEVRLRNDDAKGSRPRNAYLTERARAAIRALPRHIGSPYVFCKAAGGPGEPYVGDPSAHVCPDVIYERFKEAVEHAGLVGENGESVVPHLLRHAFMAKMRRAGVAEKRIMTLSGHHTRSAFDRYGWVDDEEARALSEDVERTVGNHDARRVNRKSIDDR